MSDCVVLSPLLPNYFFCQTEANIEFIKNLIFDIAINIIKIKDFRKRKKKKGSF